LHYILEDDADMKPMYKITSNLDFIRGEPPCKYMSVVVDDADMNTWPIATAKTITSVSAKKSITYQRWNGSVFEQQQARYICDNKYEESYVHDVPEEAQSIPHEPFLKMIECAFDDKATHADIMAVCKRAVIVVNGKLACYLRLPGIEAKPVIRIPYTNGKTDFLTEQCKPNIAKYKAGDMRPPADWVDGIQWGESLLTRLMAGGTAPPRTKVITGQTLFGDRETKEYKPNLRGPGGCHVGIDAAGLVSGLPTIKNVNAMVSHLFSQSMASGSADVDAPEVSRPEKKSRLED